MKKMILVLAMAVSANAFAVSANSTWAEINASYATDVRAPKVSFAAGNATTFLSVFDVCYAGETIQSLTEMPIYSQVSHGKGQNELVVIGSETLVRPTNYTITVGGGNHNTPVVVVDQTIAKNYMIDVYSAHQGKNSEGQLLFSKAFTMTDCK